MKEVANIASALLERAREFPERIALRVPNGREPGGATRYRDLSYGELDRECELIARGLATIGVTRGVRAALMVRPSAELFVLMFALFRAGAVPVLIDPGIDKRALKECLREAAPEAFIGIPLAHAARLALGWARASNRINVTVGRRWFWGGRTLAQVRALGLADSPHVANGNDSGNLQGPIAASSATSAAQHEPLLAPTNPDELAAILFTSGSTGVPKGVEYRHRHFLAQVDLLRNAFGIAPGEIDLPTFPPFALFDPALGMTSVIPEMDPTRPARADPQRLIDTIQRFGCTSMFGSPALLDKLSRYADAKGVRLQSLRRVISAGAPVRPEVVERAYRMLPADATVWTPYGATECLPVAVIEGRELIGEVRTLTASGAGICVGRPVPPNRVRVIRIDDGPIPQWSDALELAVGAVGEITVLGPTTTDAYFRRDRATALAKIREGADVVHRMGDVGYFDAQGRLWYAGRKSHRVETARGTLFSEQVEGIFNAVPGVFRSALVGIASAPAQRPAVCVELAADAVWEPTLDALRARAQLFTMTAGIANFLRHPAFPVDIRHNAKIGREKLALWAARQVD